MTQHPLLTPVQGSSASQFDLDLDLELDYANTASAAFASTHSPMPPRSTAFGSFGNLNSFAMTPMQASSVPFNYASLNAGFAMPQSATNNVNTNSGGGGGNVGANVRLAVPQITINNIGDEGSQPQLQVNATSNNGDDLDSFLMGSSGNGGNASSATITSFPKSPMVAPSPHISAPLHNSLFPSFTNPNNLLKRPSSSLSQQAAFNLQQQQFQHQQQLQQQQFQQQQQLFFQQQRRNILLPTASSLLMPSPMIPRPSHNPTPDDDLLASFTPHQSSSVTNSPFINASSALDPESFAAHAILDLPNFSAPPAHYIQCPYTHTCPPTTRFPNAKALRDHVRERHQTDLVHSCHECGRGFLDRVALETHACRGANGALLGANSWGGNRSRKNSVVGLGGMVGANGLMLGPVSRPASVNGDEEEDEHVEESGASRKRSKTGNMIVCEWEGCGKSFSLQKSYIVHVRTHTGEKPHICTYPDCNKAFAQPSGLRSHIFTHTGERPYKCTLCPKTYTTSSRLKIHFRAHTNEEPYACSYNGCARRFKQKSNLDQHVVTHLDPELREQLTKGNRKEVGCGECGRMYKNWASLDQHCWREHGKGANAVNGGVAGPGAMGQEGMSGYTMPSFDQDLELEGLGGPSMQGPAEAGQGSQFDFGGFA
ncbi:hypothetical protein BC830DRAFT_293109 [Chytriomyces sp. MP71]|nr:hypothetical protein BC830DRAFT_293109 [Chytriomyces sp. MP71]